MAQFHKTGAPTGHKPRKPAKGHFDANGYRAYTSSEGGARKTVREHRIVWEAHNGPIPAGCVVHHINGNKADNRLENLQLMTRSEHAKHHQCTPANETRLPSLN